MTATSAEPAPTPRPADEWAADGNALVFVARGLVLVGLGWFIGGLVGAGMAAAAVIATWKRTVGLVAASAAALMVAAGFATVFEVTPTADSLRSNFADVRPIASSLGLAAGMLAMVAVVTAAWRERADTPAQEVATSTEDGGAFPFWAPWRVLGSDEHRATVRAVLPWVVVLLISFVLMGVLAPSPLPGAMHQLVGNLRDGAGYVVGRAGHYQATGGPSPVPALVGAFGPGGATLALLVAAVGAVLLAMRLAAAHAGRSAAVFAGIGVLAIEVVTRQRLPGVLATLALLAAATLGADEHHPTPRAALAGVALGVAVLCQPWAIMGAPLLVAWLGFGHDGESTGAPSAAALALVAALVTGAPWQRYLVSRFHTWAPSTSMGFSLDAISPFLALLVLGAVIVAMRRRAAQTTVEPAHQA
jgi:hypothetical protein